MHASMHKYNGEIVRNYSSVERPTRTRIVSAIPKLCC